MEYSREIYWNVGQQVVLPMYILSGVSIVLMIWWGFWRRIKIYRNGKPLSRWDKVAKRLGDALFSTLFQTRVIRSWGAGTAHGLFFFSFMTLLSGTFLVLLQEDVVAPFFNGRFLVGKFYQWFSLSLDISGLVAILMLFGFVWRRYVIRPEGLTSNQDNWIGLSLLLLILVTGFVLEGVRIAATEMDKDLRFWSPVGLAVAASVDDLGEKALRNVHMVIWWTHLVLVMGFIAFIPFSRLRHLILIPVNVFFRDIGPTGKLVSLDLTDESIETFGAESLSDLSWKDILDSDACVSCKRCQDRCPAYATEKPLSPMQLMNQLQALAFAAPNKGSKTESDTGMIEAVSRDAIWACTTCRACESTCPATIAHVGKIVEMRRHLVLMEGAFPGPEVMAAVNQVEINGNPFGLGYADRGGWAKELGVPTLSESTNVDVMYFAGCYASYDKRNIQVARNLIKLCRAAGVRVGILGSEEKCCGEPVRKLGNEYLYQTLAEENISAFKRYGVKHIVTNCPHCFNTLSKEYRDFGLHITVEHATTFFAGLLAEGKLQLKQQAFECTYHDSCYLGRHNGIYMAPRALLNAAGGTIVEMEKNGMEGVCCGGGGGRILAEETLGERMNTRRVNMAMHTGAPLLASSCPFCLTMFEDAARAQDIEENIIPKDMLEILAERL